ncbi:Insulinase Peptidase family M16 family protein [Heracleum sosnowskyi]|uniref:Insulinase Peptidase family M16 family protein n=1 Tax=Heracleum sosnowskyi TaxID=360622 RepID=A0AAD8GR61_9APIA|nr:Insulinase Peptidase family M16 family protein [Heracleum sosnowskyi]
MAVGGCAYSSDDIVIKSPTDRRLYRYIRLKNGLCALLIHDPDIYDSIARGPGASLEDDEELDDDEEEEDSEDDDDIDDDESEEDDKEKQAAAQTKKAAAAMCVGMGSFSDPLEAQGLAHFLEHMLFMGSSQFPDENEYDSYLSKHGGSSNAYTEAEHTCYHFEVKPEFLEGALKRFSQFFISPLVKAEAMERELLAVDSEYNQVVQNDSCRLQQLQCHTSTSGHPLNQFFWGNKKSLGDAMEKGVDLRERILKLYSDYYHGELMKLVVIGGEALDVLESWVLELFGDVKSGVALKHEFKSGIPIWKTGQLYRLEAVKDIHMLDISWTLPSLRKDYMKKSEDYLAHLLGHEGKGSLHYFLKAKGWATSISAGVGDEGMHKSSIAYIFGMSIHLTDSGLEKIFEIIGFVYQYIKLLRQVPPQKWIFKELQDIGNMEFRFAEEQPQDDYAAELAENLLVYPPEDVIYGDYSYKVWDDNMIKYVLGFFTPDNMRTDVISKKLHNTQKYSCEPWFGSKYVEEDISPMLMELWRDPSAIDISLHLPARNEFIPSDFSIRAGKASGDTNNSLPGAYDHLKNYLLSELFIQLLRDELNEIIYQASVAKLETSVSLHSDKLELKVYGFNDKLPVILSRVLSITKSFVPRDDRFKVIKENLERSLRNTNMKPLNHSSYLRLQVLCQSFWDVDEKLKLLDHISVSDVRDFIPELLSQLYIEGLCHGNLLKEEALNISNIFRSCFPVKTLPFEMRHKESVMCLSSGSNLVWDDKVKNKLEPNSVVELYYQIEPELEADLPRLKALIDLFDEIVEEPLFNQLRTKEQLGYVVDCSPRVTYRILGFCFRVQSSEYNPIHLQGRIDEFINSLENLLNGLDDESFMNYKSGLTAKLLEKDPSLAYETNRFWGQIVDQRYVFDLSEKEATELDSIRKSDVVNWYKTYLRQPSPKCRRLAVRLWGCNTNLEDSHVHITSVQPIRDMADFKKSSKFYPAIC